MITIIMSGCSSKNSGDSGTITKKNTLVYGAEFEDEKINPILDSTYEDDLLFRGLMKHDENNVPQNDLAKEVIVSSDNLTYTFKIRDGVKFHDGETLTAADVVFTIKSIMEPSVNSSRATDFREVASIEKVDDLTVKIVLKQTFPPLLDKLTVGIVPEHVFTGKNINDSDFNHNPIGCGPYKFVSWTTGESLTMTRFADFYGEQAKIENVIFKFLPDYNTRAVQLESGEIDLAFIEPSQVEKIKSGQNTAVHIIDSADYRCMMYNFTAPILPLQDPLEVDLNQVLQAPSLNHYCGTDNLGRDIFARVLYGGIVSLSIATIATTAGITIGIIYGGISGYNGGKTDAVLMRFVEILYAIPATIIILCFQMMAPNKVIGLVIIMSLTSWMTMARVIRGRFMELKQKEFVALARGMNTPTWKILFNHLARNSVSSIIIVFTFTFSSAIMNEAALSFLGVGVPQEIPSWGNMIFNAQNYILTGVWWAALFPGIMIVLSTMCVNYISEDLKNKYLI
ncbi:ABC transporter substrate-binding protein [Acetobacterium sp.]|uniref:ABC transporter substrate-binding protein n=1 Tax=Acetobacterium sp. TaxID=1872094 RepID=UPI002717A1AF|nr:ABC transporter substrate-binding protein [Acetobacterium sp.]MDO9491522.1 ABC transporter substrate-binding protein [Acetobacterium sp.]